MHFVSSEHQRAPCCGADIQLTGSPTNAQSPWQNRFKPANTIQGNFSLSSTPGAKTVSCNMMNQVFNEFAAEYAEEDTSQAVRLPFSVRCPAHQIGVCDARCIQRKRASGELVIPAHQSSFTVSSPPFAGSRL